jgi:hypothetical protein
METLAMIRQTFHKKARAIHGHLIGMLKLTETGKGEQAESKGKSMIITFFDIKAIVPKEFILAGLTVSSAYYCDILGHAVA